MRRFSRANVLPCERIRVNAQFAQARRKAFRSFLGLLRSFGSGRDQRAVFVTPAQPGRRALLEPPCSQRQAQPDSGSHPPSRRS